MTQLPPDSIMNPERWKEDEHLRAAERSLESLALGMVNEKVTEEITGKIGSPGEVISIFAYIMRSEDKTNWEVHIRGGLNIDEVPVWSVTDDDVNDLREVEKLAEEMSVLVADNWKERLAIYGLTSK